MTDMGMVICVPEKLLSSCSLPLSLSLVSASDLVTKDKLAIFLSVVRKFNGKAKSSRGSFLMKFSRPHKVRSPIMCNCGKPCNLNFAYSLTDNLFSRLTSIGAVGEEVLCS